MQSQDKISLVLISKNEEKHIPKFIDSLKKQTRKPDEIILVDSSTDNTVKLMKPHVNKTITVPARGCAAARNRGVKESTGNIIVFTDIDTVLYPDWLENLTRPFGQEKVKVVQGKIFSKSYDGKKDKGIFASGLKEWGKFICGCNVAFRRDIFEQYPLDENMLWEDIEQGYRITRSHKIYGARDAIVYHYGPMTFTENRPLENSAIWSGKGWAKILMKHKNPHWFFRIYFNLFNVWRVHGWKAFRSYFREFHKALRCEMKGIEYNESKAGLKTLSTRGD